VYAIQIRVGPGDRDLIRVLTRISDEVAAHEIAQSLRPAWDEAVVVEGDA